MVFLKEDKCQGCSLCVEACPKKILMIDHTRVNKRGYSPVMITDQSKCTSCTLCAIMCPDVVIEVRKEA